MKRSKDPEVTGIRSTYLRDPALFTGRGGGCKTGGEVSQVLPQQN